MTQSEHYPELVEFLAGFVRPLVSGGKLRVGRPVSAEVAEAWEALAELDLDSEDVAAISAERHRTASTIVVAGTPIPLAGEDVRLAVCLHAALVLAHPDLEGWTARGSRKAIARMAHRLLAGLPPAVGRERLLSRHTLLAHLPGLQRIDTRVTWWTGSATFRGQEPPARLLRWQGVRRVRQQKLEQHLEEVISEEGLEILSAVVRASPLTALMSAGELAPMIKLDWRGTTSVLRDVELARAVAYQWLGALDPANLEAAVRRLALAGTAWAESAVDLPGDELRAVTAFLVHLAGLVALAEVHGSDLDAPSAAVTAALSRARPGRADELTRGAGTASELPLLPAAPPLPPGGTLFFAIPELVGRVAPELARPPGIAEDPRASRRWAAHRAQARAMLAQTGERLGVLNDRLKERLAGAGSGARAPSGGS